MEISSYSSTSCNGVDLVFPDDPPLRLFSDYPIGRFRYIIWEHERGGYVYHKIDRGDWSALFDRWVYPKAELVKVGRVPPFQGRQSPELNRLLLRKVEILEGLSSGARAVQDTAAATYAASMFIAGFVVPGPEDLVFQALLKSKGLTVAGSKLFREGEELTGRALLDAMEDLHRAAPDACRIASKKAGDVLDRIQEAKRQFQKNKSFRNWAHKEFMEDMKMGGGGRRNPDIPDSMIADAYEEWLQLGKPKL